MDTTAKLIDVHVPREPEALVVVLHGGGSREGGVAVSPTQLSVLRMIPIAKRVARVARRRLAVFRLLNSTRGWDTGHTPADDAAWALDELANRFGHLPAGLVGHSLGGRAALLAAGRPDVRSVVALAPWVTPDDGRQDASGSRILIVHGTADRIASPQRSAVVADRLRRSATSLAYVEVDGGKHAMLSKSGVFTSPAASFTGAVLLDPPPKTSSFTDELVAGRAEPWRV